MNLLFIFQSNYQLSSYGCYTYGYNCMYLQILEWTLAENQQTQGYNMMGNSKTTLSSYLRGWFYRNLHGRMKIQVIKYCFYLYIKNIGLGFFWEKKISAYLFLCPCLSR
jgi:hypothetical protein